MKPGSPVGVLCTRAKMVDTLIRSTCKKSMYHLSPKPPVPTTTPRVLHSCQTVCSASVLQSEAKTLAKEIRVDLWPCDGILINGWSLELFLGVLVALDQISQEFIQKLLITLIGFTKALMALCRLLESAIQD